MAESSQEEEFALIAEPVSGRAYAVQAKIDDTLFRTQTIQVDSYKFSLWLRANGCEFCAHQVKLGLSVHCNHIMLSPTAILQLRALQT